MRKLVSIETISDIQPIPNADNIVVATVKGWEVVVKKGEFTVGEKAVYFEIDSWIPKEVAPFLCNPSTAKTYLGIEGARLRTIKLRGQLSQGLLLPILSLVEKGYDLSNVDNLDEILNIRKYEHVITNTTKAKGSFPSFIIKTDEERVQNLNYQNYINKLYYCTEKLNGSSMTVFLRNDEFGVCSRNVNLKEEDGSKFWHVANLYNLREKLEKFGKNIALQGELIGEGIQKNPYQLNGNDFYVFTLFDIDNFKKAPYNVMKDLCCQMGLKTVPVLDLEFRLPNERKKLIEFADGKSVLNQKTIREGIVCRTLDNDISFKVISNKFLLKD